MGQARDQHKGTLDARFCAQKQTPQQSGRFRVRGMVSAEAFQKLHSLAPIRALGHRTVMWCGASSKQLNAVLRQLRSSIRNWKEQSNSSQSHVPRHARQCSALLASSSEILQPFDCS